MVYHLGEASHSASFPTGRLPEDHLLPAGGKLTENSVYFGKHLKNKVPKQDVGFGLRFQVLRFSSKSINRV